MKFDDVPFYVGYRPRADAATRRFVQAVVGIGGAPCDRRPRAARPRCIRARDAGVFEWGATRTFEGVVRATPVPRLELEVPGAPGLRELLLVAAFKHGAQELVAPLDGRRVRAQGTLIHRGETAMLELGDAACEDLGPASPRASRGAARRHRGARRDRGLQVLPRRHEARAPEAAPRLRRAVHFRRRATAVDGPRRRRHGDLLRPDRHPRRSDQPAPCSTSSRNRSRSRVHWNAPVRCRTCASIPHGSGGRRRRRRTFDDDGDRSFRRPTRAGARRSAWRVPLALRHQNGRRGGSETAALHGVPRRTPRGARRQRGDRTRRGRVRRAMRPFVGRTRRRRSRDRNLSAADGGDRARGTRVLQRDRVRPRAARRPRARPRGRTRARVRGRRPSQSHGAVPAVARACFVPARAPQALLLRLLVLDQSTSGRRLGIGRPLRARWRDVGRWRRASVAVVRLRRAGSRDRAHERQGPGAVLHVPAPRRRAVRPAGDRPSIRHDRLPDACKDCARNGPAAIRELLRATFRIPRFWPT
jgi:hypothetical protein